ncbi:MAG: hypothetical protein ACOX8P_07310 [Tepidanaerobacteraceae bacterium]|jgi:hypothetical protein
MIDSLKTKLKLCRLSGIGEHYDRIFSEANERSWTLDAFLEALLDQEIATREDSRFQRLLAGQVSYPKNNRTVRFLPGSISI